jgi:hypothetical protein
LSAGSDVLTKVQETIVQQNQTAIVDEGIVYRVVKIEWVNLITSIDNITSGNTQAGSNVRKSTIDCFLFAVLFILL